MKKIFVGAKIYKDGKFQSGNLCVEDGKVYLTEKESGTGVSDASGLCIFPAFSDVHVHLREPGFSYKETVKTGTKAAAKGGYSSVCTMPNLNPVPDSVETLSLQLDIIKKDACINVFPFASITKGEKGEELSDFDELSPYVRGFSDDGRGVQSREMMKAAMKKAKALDRIIVAHCEDNSLLFGGYIHDGEYAKAHGHKGICSESEWKPIERDLELVEEIGCKYHVCHISTKESVELIRRAKAKGLDVTCETAPHYLILTDKLLKEEGRFKMNPPIRSEEDRKALIEGIADGTIDMIATDHAPHSAEEKSKGLKDSAMGIVGIETAFSSLYTKLCREGIITLERLIELFAVNPAKRFNLPYGFEKGNFTIFNLEESEIVNPDKFLSMGRSTPFEGEKFYGVCQMTYVNGELAYSREKGEE